MHQYLFFIGDFPISLYSNISFSLETLLKYFKCVKIKV